MSDLEWASGFSHAEDSFGFYVNGSYGYSYAHLTIGQSERAPLDELVRILGEGKVYGPYKNSTPGSLIHLYQLGKSLVAEAIYCLLTEQPLTWDKIVQ